MCGLDGRSAFSCGTRTLVRMSLVMTRKIIYFFIFCCFFFCAGNASAQIAAASTVKPKAAIKPQAKPAERKIDYAKKVTITRVEKKSRKNYKRTVKKVVRRVSVPLLAVQFRLMLVGEDRNETEANPLAEFTASDRLRLSMEANQRGYLYIIRQRTTDEDGEIIFPTPLVNGGSNLVEASTEYGLPFNCPKEAVPNPRDCALALTDAGNFPQEFFTLIFTRDQLVDLPNDVRNTRVSLENLLSSGKIKAETLVALIEDSGQDLVSQQGDSPYAVRIINTNAKDNEEIIETFVLKKKLENRKQ